VFALAVHQRERDTHKNNTAPLHSMIWFCSVCPAAWDKKAEKRSQSVSFASAAVSAPSEAITRRGHLLFMNAQTAGAICAAYNCATRAHFLTCRVRFKAADVPQTQLETLCALAVCLRRKSFGERVRSFQLHDYSNEKTCTEKDLHLDFFASCHSCEHECVKALWVQTSDLRETFDVEGKIQNSVTAKKFFSYINMRHMYIFNANLHVVLGEKRLQFLN